MEHHRSPFNTEEPLLAQLARRGLEFDQQMSRAFQVSASQPNIEPEDCGFPDSYLLLALYRSNTVLTRLVCLDETRYNLFHEYHLAPRRRPEQVVAGRRLCSILEYVASRPEVTDTIGVGHFLKAVIHLSLRQEAEDLGWLGFSGQVSHNTFSIETLLWGLGYTAWTPVEEAPEVERLLRCLDEHPAIEDFQYILVPKENRIVFRPVSILDDYVQRTESGILVPQRAFLTHFKDTFGGFTSDEIQELEELLNADTASERDFQEFFERHPHFFRKWDYREVYPQVCLARPEGPLIPDFILTDKELQKAAIVDLKLPTARLVRRQKNRDRFTDAVMAARSQLLRYRDWFLDPDNRRSLQGKVEMDIYQPQLSVVIGRSSDFTCGFDRQELRADNPDIDIVTYDDIVTFAKRRRMIIETSVSSSERHMEAGDKGDNG